ncbi:MAG: hypothetical protein AAGA66_02095 [Bacteroidota bacterium]
MTNFQRLKAKSQEPIANSQKLTANRQDPKAKDQKPTAKSLIAKLVLLLSLLLALRPQAQILDQFPADVTPVVAPPYSLFLSDYGDPAFNLLTATILFNDFNEASWTFRLKLRIESPDILIETHPAFVPSVPITVVPGEPLQFTGADWAEYLRYENLRIAGDRETFLNSGRLPEGNYRVTVQVLDYATGEPLSAESSFFWWMGLFSPPLLNLPLENAHINPNETQITFTWQLFNVMSPNGPQTNYQFTLYEVVDADAASPESDPLSAFQNGQLLEIYRSDLLPTTSFVYGLSEPSLDIGTAYIYRVQAVDANNRDVYKNNGYSEFRRFYYGWPTGGTIGLEFPGDDEGFLQWDVPGVRWSSPDNRLPNQPVSYELRIAEKEKTETSEEALRGNLWYHYESGTSTTAASESHRLLDNLQHSTSYAWEVIGYSSEREVARSKAQTFHGPPLLERFYAGNHVVLVDRVNDDADNLIGKGRVRLTAPGSRPEDDVWTPFEFEGLKVELSGTIWVLKEGEILFPSTEETATVNLTPTYKDNGAATFSIEQYRLNKDGLYVRGEATWDLPHATVSAEKPVVRSIQQWANYNNYKVNSVIAFPEDANRFDLLEPYGFTLDLNETSLIYINSNEYWFDLDGEALVPTSVGSRYDERVSFTFRDQEQLYFIESDEPSLTASNEIQPIKNTGLWLKTNQYEIDLSDDFSSGDLSPDWLGIHLSSIELTYDESFDNAGQFDLDASYQQTHDGSQGTFRSSIVSGGLNLDIDCLYPEGTEFRFQTFMSNPYRLKLKIEEDYVDESSEIKGRFLIPFVSTEDQFTYRVPATGAGLKKGYLEGLDGYRFIHGTDDQRVDVTIRNATLSGNEKINMALALKWNALGMDIDNITGFRVWGDHHIGFGEKGGAISLPERVNTVMKGYDVTIDVIAAGNTEGYYGFASILEIEMGEDVSGVEDVPKTNFYGLMENPYAPEGLDASGVAPPDTGGDQKTLEEFIAEKEVEIEERKENFLETISNIQLDAGEVEYGESAYETSNLYSRYEPDTNSEKTVDNQGLSEAQLGKVELIASGVTEVLLTEYFDGQLNRIDSVKNWVEGQITEKSAQLEGRIQNGADSIVNTIGNLLVNAVSGMNDPDLTSLVEGLKRDAASVIAYEAKQSFKRSVQNNITIPITTLIDNDIKGGIRDVAINISNTTITSVMLGESVDDLGNQLLKDLNQGANEILGKVGGAFRPANLLSAMEEVITTTFLGINQDSIFQAMKGKVMKRGAEFVLKKGLDELGDSMTGELGEYVSAAQQLYETGISVKNTVENISNFIKDPKRALKDMAADRMPIRNPNNPLFDLNGYVQFYQYHPNYGDVWVGDVDLTIKVPSQFTLNTYYLQGKKDGSSYYFAEVKVTEESNGTKELGDPLDELAPASLPNGPKLGSMRLVGIGGRLYKRMKIQEDRRILPDPSLRYGWQMGLVLFDDKSGGQKLRIAVSGGSTKSANGDHTWNFKGEVQMNSSKPELDKKDPTAALHGLIEISYNSGEKEFIGYIEGDFKSEVVCISGSLFVNTRPGYWRVAIGSLEEPIDVTVPCPGLRFIGFLDISSERLEVGGGIGFGGQVRVPKKGNISLFVAQTNVVAYAWAEVGGGFAIRWKPLTPEKLFIWLEIRAGLDVNYRLRKFSLRKKWGNWKTINLLEILIRGDAAIHFYPRPITLEGSFSVRFKVVGIGFSFKAKGRAEL